MSEQNYLLSEQMLDDLYFLKQNFDTWSEIHKLSINGTNIKGDGIHVAIIDSGIKKDYTCTRNVISEKFKYYLGTDGILDCYDEADKSHGQMLANIIGAENYVGVENVRYDGIAPKAKIVPIRIMSKDTPARLSSLTWALEKILLHNKSYPGNFISVVNISLAEQVFDNEDNALMHISDPKDMIKSDSCDHEKYFFKMNRAIKLLSENGVAIICSSGNYFKQVGLAEGLTAPGIFSDCIAVGALNNDNSQIQKIFPSNLRIYSEYVKEKYPMYEVVPVKGLPNYPTSNNQIQQEYLIYAESLFTSSATALLSGLIALVQQCFLLKVKRYPSMDEIRNLLKETNSTCDLGSDSLNPRPRKSLLESLKLIKKLTEDELIFNLGNMGAMSPQITFIKTDPFTHKITVNNGIFWGHATYFDPSDRPTERDVIFQVNPNDPNPSGIWINSPSSNFYDPSARDMINVYVIDSSNGGGNPIAEAHKRHSQMPGQGGG